MDLALSGRRAVVTGGTRGIGKAIARALAAEGCDVGLVARHEVALEATAAELAGESGRRVVALRFAPGMAERGWGRIINVSGLAARQAGTIVGSVRNVAVAAMTKNLADELGASGINVTVVHPGMTRTERTPQTLTAMADSRGVSVAEVEAALTAPVAIGRLVTAEEVAAVVTFLASPLSVAITGDAIAAGGGVRGAIYY